MPDRRRVTDLPEVGEDGECQEERHDRHAVARHVHVDHLLAVLHTHTTNHCVSLNRHTNTSQPIGGFGSI